MTQISNNKQKKLEINCLAVGICNLEFICHLVLEI